MLATTVEDAVTGTPLAAVAVAVAVFIHEAPSAATTVWEHVNEIDLPESSA